MIRHHPDGSVDTRPTDRTDVDTLDVLLRALKLVPAGAPGSVAAAWWYSILVDGQNYANQRDFLDLMTIAHRIALNRGWVAGVRRP